MDDQDVASLVGGIALVVILVVIAWLIVLPSSGTSGGPDRTGRVGDVASGTTSAHQSSSDQLQRCIAADEAIRLPLRRAASSIHQWNIHAGAMNKLVAGAMTPLQATTFWNRTHVVVRHRVARFERAWAHLQRHGTDCPRPDRLTSQAPQQLRSCARQVVIDMRVLYAARAAIDTWRRNMHSLDMVRMGTTSSSTASPRWTAMWGRGQRRIDAYHVAARAARGVSGCVSTVPSSSTVPFLPTVP